MNQNSEQVFDFVAGQWSQRLNLRCACGHKCCTCGSVMEVGKNISKTILLLLLLLFIIYIYIYIYICII
jgi:hypothetical protein